MLILLVSVRWQLLPASGYVPPSEDLGRSIQTMLMPAFVLGTAIAATLMRHTRSAMLGVLSSDYVRTARAKGLAESVVMFRHVLKNAMIPILTGVVVVIPLLFMGSLIVESFFGIPGLGSYTLDAIQSQDFAVVRVMVFIGSVLNIVGLLLTDISYTLVDPRVRLN
jgi:peptide/nickel transport system permease protein